MKRVFVALSLVMAVSSFSVPTFAAPSGGVVPPECALQTTKDKHPDWYRDGGYCSPDNGSTYHNGISGDPGFGSTDRP